MSVVLAVSSQIWAIAQLIPAFGKYRMEKNTMVSAARGSTREALNRTIIFMRKNDFSDDAERANLSTLWNVASEKVSIFDKHLGRTLGMKSRFWADPEAFERTGSDKDIMRLKEVADELERLYMQLS